MRRSVLVMLAPLVLITGALVVPSAGQAVTNPANRRVAASTDATTVSVAVSQEFFPTGKSLDTVVVARGDVFPDNLNGSALAGTVRGALLLTDGGPTASLRSEVLTEINRVLKAPTPGACTPATTDVFILGGTAAVSATAQQSIESVGWCVTRLGGANRVETALLIAGTIRQRSGATASAFVARSDNPADSAAGGALAGRHGIPIAVNPTATLDASVGAFLFGGAPFNSTVTLLGGSAALSASVESDLGTLAATSGSGTKVDRLAGSARDGTAAKIAERYLQTESNPNGVNVIIVNGYTADGWVHALVGGSVSWQENVVVLYVQADAVPSETCKYLQAHRPGTVITLGPTSRVSDATKKLAQDIASGTTKCGTTTTSTTTTSTTVPNNGPYPSQDQALVDAVNAYRRANGLPTIPTSPALMEVARRHVEDFQANGYLGHSWGSPGSSGQPANLWKQCTFDGTTSSTYECMWAKPAEITAGWTGVRQPFTGFGFENSGTGYVTPTAALTGWKTSPAHNDVILNKSFWTSPWLSIGCAITPSNVTGGSYNVCWFSDTADPNPPPAS